MNNVFGRMIETKNQISVLWILFESRLQWGPQVTNTLNKANKALNAIRLIKNYFNTNELLQLVTSNFYSVLFYNSEVWHLRTLNQSMKNQLLSISAKALKLWMKTLDLWMLSFNNLHEMAGRATPEKLGDYKLALRLYKVFKNQIPTQDWVNLNYNIIQTSRQTNFMIAETNRLKMGMNLI